jgi:hypothetical protein
LSIVNWKNLRNRVEGYFRIVAFEFTTDYGRTPGDALALLGYLLIIFALIYVFCLCQRMQFQSPAYNPHPQWLVNQARYRWYKLRRFLAEGRIYQFWSSDCITVGHSESNDTNAVMWSVMDKAHMPRIAGQMRVVEVKTGFWAALMYGAYFSVLSAFHLGWRDFNIGTWIARMQAFEYTLRATGWVRFLSGLQSLLSVYLLAIWALTYFGRPF